MPFLKVIDGTDKGQLRELKGAKTVIGRHPDCDIEVTVPAASRHHAQIVCVANEYFVEDLHSRNGTFLNDEQIQGRIQLNDGDLIRVADSVYLFQPSVGVNGQPSSGTGDRPVRTYMVDEDGSSSNLKCVSKVDAPSSASQQGTNASVQVLEAQLEALSQISQRVQRVLELDRVLPEILECLFVIFAAADRGFIVLQSDDGNFHSRWARLRDKQSQEALPISRTIVEQVMESQQAILSADAADDERFAHSKSLGAVPIRSLMCAPLIDKSGKSFGALQIDTTGDRDRFQPADLRLLCNVAAQASIAVETSRLHERLLKQQAVERELELALQIQRSFLPKHLPVLPGYFFFDYYQPANHVGGDFYDYIPMPDGRLGIVVADVVGHGVGAAMLTAKLAADVRYKLLSLPRPVDAVNELNESLSRDLLEDHFVTLVLAVLTPGTGEVVIVNAGHLPPLRSTLDGRVVDVGVEESGWPLGIVADAPYRQCELRLEPGEVVTLYTDGVNESLNLAGQMYGIARIRDHIRQAPHDLDELGTRIIHDVREHARGFDQSDDMCLICLARQ